MSKKLAVPVWLLVLFFLIVLAQYWRIRTLELRVDTLHRPIIYQVDNTGGSMAQFGKITDKKQIDKLYTVTAGGYGRFLVTKEQYESINIGDSVPDYLRKRGD